MRQEMNDNDNSASRGDARRILRDIGNIAACNPNLESSAYLSGLKRLVEAAS